MAQDVPSEEPQTSLAVSESGAHVKLFLGGLSWETTEDKLKQHFGKYGEIDEVVVMRDRITQKPRGFGFITFKEEGAADRACQDVHTIDGRTIDAKPSVPHSEGQRPRSKKIFVGGLAPDTTEDLFKAHFEQFGKIVEAQIMVDHNSGRSRGFGFITFDDESSVERVFTAGSMQELGGKKVEVKTATPKGSGPQGPSRFSGRGAFAPPAAGRGFPGGRAFPAEYGQMGFGVPGYLPPGYAMPYGYGMPYPSAAYNSMLMQQMQQYGYAGYGYSYGQGYTSGTSSRYSSYSGAGRGRGQQPGQGQGQQQPQQQQQGQSQQPPQQHSPAR